MTKTIIIADDHPLVTVGMETAINASEELTLVGKASDGIEAIAKIKLTKPDCAVLDLMMPGATGLEVFLEAKKWSPKTRFVVVTGTATAAHSFKKLYDSGINGLLVKNSEPDHLCSQIIRIIDGERIICDEAIVLIQEIEQTTELTKREKQVLYAISEGKSNNVIAEELFVSPKTINTHRTKLLKKLNVNSTAAMLVKAIKTGIILPDKKNK